MLAEEQIDPPLTRIDYILMESGTEAIFISIYYLTLRLETF